jgi:hypothetical protein
MLAVIRHARMKHTPLLEPEIGLIVGDHDAPFGKGELRFVHRALQAHIIRESWS